MEKRLLEVAKDAGRVKLENSQRGGGKLPESDTADMEVFLTHIQQLLPILGSDLLSLPTTSNSGSRSGGRLRIRIKGLAAYGDRTDSGFVVYSGSQAVPDDRPSANAWSRDLRVRLIEKGVVKRQANCLLFIKNYEFSSPSAAAGIIRGGNSNGLTSWKHEDTGQRLRDLDAEE